MKKRKMLCGILIAFVLALNPLTVNAKNETTTEFYLQIENPKDPGESDETTDVEKPDKKPVFPQTGDHGWNLKVVLSVALLCGVGYMICDYYEERKKE